MAVAILLWFVSCQPLCTSPPPVHPIYISLLEVTPGKDSDVLECSMKIFSDDLEKAVRQWTGNKDSQQVSRRDGIWKYILTHLQFRREGVPAQIQLIGLEGDPDAHWVHFEVRFQGTTLPRNFELQWSTLLEAFPDQRNILHVTRDSRTLSYIFDSGKTRQIIPLTE